MSGPAPELDITQEDRAGRITLDRPQHRNALTLDMARGIRHALSVWRTDPTVELVLLEGAGEDGFCGGSDLGALCRDSMRALGNGPGMPDSQYPRVFWRETAQLARDIARYPKPIVVFIDGLVAGSGVGLAAHATYRVISERARLALPETAIGLVPDLGVTWLLARAPAPAGAIAALTGRVMDSNDAIRLGLADGIVAYADMLGLRDRLASRFGGPPERILNGFAREPGPSALVDSTTALAPAFAHPSVERIVAALGSLDAEGAKATSEALQSRSPLATKLTLTLLHRVASMRTLEEALQLEHRVLTRLFEHGEVHEGVRARLMDGSRAPAWPLPRLADVDPPLLASFVSPLLPGEDLRFA